MKDFERVIDDFEAAWQRGERPVIRDLLPDQEPERHALLVELVLIDFEFRLKAGETVRVEDCLREFPELADDASVVVDLAATEYDVRRRAETIDHDTFLARFPKHRAALADRMKKPAVRRARRLLVRLNCPHCRNPIAIVDDGASDELTCPSCGSSFNLAQDRTTSWNPERLPQLGKFRLQRKVGHGAFGAVYEALDTELDRIVAVKIPRSGQLAERDDEDRFLREARSAAQLRHPGIVPVFEVGRSEEFPYLVSEFVDGVTLASRLTARPFTFREAAELITQIADALHHAHEQGVVHRDLKPANIMLESSDGLSSSSRGDGSSSKTSTLDCRPRVMDFGLARRDEGEITVTIEGQLLGTPAYMSPEQARGESHHVDGRSDLYSLGVILYELLVGELPFRGNKEMLLHQLLRDEPPPPRRLNHRIPRDLETITLKCLAKEPHRRYASAGALAADLRCHLAGKPIQARPISSTERAWRWCRRNPAVASLSAAVLLVLIAGICVSSYFAFQSARRNRDLFKQTRVANEKSRDAVAQSKRANEQKDLADAKAAELRRNLYISHMNLALAACDDNRVVRVVQLLEPYADSESADLRGFEWHYLQRICHRDLLTLNGELSHVKGVAFSPDGTRIASTSWHIVRLWDATTGQETATLKGHTTWITSVTFSPDSAQVASASADHTVMLWDAATGQMTATLKGHTSSVTSVAFSPDGARIASASYDQTVKLWDATTGQETATLTGHSGIVTSVTFSPDGARIVSASRDQTAKLWDTATGKETATLKGHTGSILSVALSPDGAQVASASDDRTVKLWDVATRRENRDAERAHELDR